MILTALAALLALQTTASAARAEETKSVEPYIDSIREKMRENGTLPAAPAPGAPVDPYLQSIRQKLEEKEGPPSTETEPFIKKLKEDHPERFVDDSKGYSDKQRALLPPDPEADKSAIAAVNEGHSELKLKRPGKITQAFGFKFGTAYSRNITGSAGTVAAPFQEVYGNHNIVPDITIFYEYKLFHHEYAGSLGLIASAGTSFYKGNGIFEVPDLTNLDGSSFGHQSHLQLTFFAVPVSVGVNYRFSLTHYVRPFVQVAPTAVGYYEARNDSRKGYRGKSVGVTFTGGASILLDWITRADTWNLYDDFSVKHSYLTVEYSRLTTPTSDVDFAFNGVTAGFTFEY